MSSILFIIPALLQVLFSAWRILISEGTNIQNVHAFMVWRGLIPALFCAIVASVSPWFTLPQSPLFYVASALAGCIVSYTDAVHLKAPAEHSGEIYAKVSQMGVLYVFLFSLATVESFREQLLGSPMRMALALAGFAVLYFARTRLKKAPLTLAAIIAMTPAVLLSNGTNMANGFALNQVPQEAIQSGVLTYIFIVSSIVLIVNSAILRGKVITAFTEKATRADGLKIGSLFVFILLAKTSAIALAPTPAYVIAVGALTPFAVAGINRIRGKVSTASPEEKRTGWLIFGAITLLMLSTADF